MTDFIESPLDLVDLLLILAGGLVLVAGAIGWRREAPRDPLQGAPIRLNVLSAFWLWLALLFYGAAVIGSLGFSFVYSPPGIEGDILMMQRSVLAGNLMQVLVILASLWILSRTFVAGLRGAGLGRKPIGTDLFAAGRGFLVAFSLCTLVAMVTEILILLAAPTYELPVHTVFEALEHPDTPRFIGWVAIGGAFLLAPLAEELFFRGIFQTGLHRILPARWGSLRHRWAAILGTPIMFGLMHLPIAQHVPALIVLAIILGYQYERSGSLVVPTLVHILFNGKSLLWHWLAA